MPRGFLVKRFSNTLNPINLSINSPSNGTEDAISDVDDEEPLPLLNKRHVIAISRYSDEDRSSSSYSDDHEHSSATINDSSSPAAGIAVGAVVSMEQNRRTSPSALKSVNQSLPISDRYHHHHSHHSTSVASRYHLVKPMATIYGVPHIYTASYSHHEEVSFFLSPESKIGPRCYSPELRSSFLHMKTAILAIGEPKLTKNCEVVFHFIRRLNDESCKYYA